MRVAVPGPSKNSLLEVKGCPKTTCWKVLLEGPGMQVVALFMIIYVWVLAMTCVSRLLFPAQGRGFNWAIGGGTVTDCMHSGYQCQKHYIDRRTS